MVVKSQPEAHTVSVAGKGVGVGGIGVGVGGIGVAVGGIGVGVTVGVAVGSTGVLVGASVSVGGASVAVGSVTAGCEVVHPVRTTKTTVINVCKGLGFISISSANGLLFSLRLKRANVAGCIR